MTREPLIEPCIKFYGFHLVRPKEHLRCLRCGTELQTVLENGECLHIELANGEITPLNESE